MPTPPKAPERVFRGMAEQKNRPQKQRNARGLEAAGAVGTILPSDLAIPCRVAPLQSPTPFHQATSSVAWKSRFSAEFPLAREIQNRHKRLPGPAVENRHQAPTGSLHHASAICRSTNRNPWYNTHSHSPIINPLSVLKRRASVDSQAPRDSGAACRGRWSSLVLSWDI